MSSDLVGVNSHAVEKALDDINVVHVETAGMGKVDVKVNGKIIKTGQGESPEPTYTPVTPIGNENPKELGWYEKVGDNYVLTNDTTVDALKTYYVKS